MLSPTLGNVLVVDDEVQLMNALMEALGSQGYQVTGLATGEAALEAMQRQEFDLLLTDLMMPGMDGISLLKAALALDKNLVGIIMTGQGTVPTAVEAMKTGAFDYILKPFRLEAMLPVLARAREVRRLRMENIQLRETVAIYNLSQTIAFSLDTRLVLENTADAALQQTDADEVSIMLLTADRQELFVAAVRGKDREHLLGQRVSMQEGIAGWVARQTESLILNGEVADSRFTPVWPRAEIHSAISMPMLAAGKMVGVLNVNTLKARHSFTPGQVKALSILTSTASAALENESMYRALEAREKHFRALIENSADAVTLLNPEGRFTYTSASARRVLGYEPEELAGQNAFDLIHPDDLQTMLAGFMDALQKPGEVGTTELRVRHKDGSWRWIEGAAQNLLDEPSVGAIVVNFSDITERKRADDQMKYHARLLRHINDAVIAIDDGFRITAWNRAAETMYGWSNEEVIGRNVSEILSDEFTDEQRAEARELLKESTISRDQRIYHRKDGRTIYVEANTIAFTDAQGKIAGYVSVDRDITDRKQAEQEIESLANFPRENTGPVLRFARDGRLLYANHASADLLRLWDCEIGDKPPDEIQLIVYQSLIMPMSREIEVAHEHKIDALMFVPIVDKDYVNVYGRDVTARRQAEQAVLESERQMRALVTSLDDIVFELDNQGRYLNVWAANEDLLARPKAQLLGRTILEVLGEASGRRFTEGVQRVLASGDPENIEYPLELQGVQHWFVARISPVHISEDAPKTVSMLIQDITERKRAEEALRESEIRFRSLIENSSDEISILSAEGKLMYESPTANPTLGYQLGEFLGRNLFQLIHPDDLARVQEQLARLIQDPDLHPRDQFRLRHQNGDWRWVEAVGTNLLSEPSVRGIVVNYHDITDRKQAEAALRESEKRYRNLFERITHGFALHEIICDETGRPIDYRFLEINPAFEALTGLRASEVIGRTVLEVLPGTEQYWIETYGRVALTGESIQFENHAQELGKDYEVIAYCPKPGQFAALFSDVTDRKRAEAERQQTEAKYRTLVEQLPAIIYISSVEQGALLYISPQVEALGYSQAEWLSNDPPLWPKLIHPDDRDRVMAEFMQNQILGQPAHSEYRFITRDGRVRWFRDEAQMVRGESGQPLYLQGVMVDITERKEADEALRKAYARTESVLASVADTHILIDREWRYRYVNDAAVRAMGRSREQILGRTIWETYPDIIGTELERQYHRTMDERIPVDFEFHYQTRDTWWDNHFYPVPEGLAVFATDITERRRAETLLAQNERKYRTLTENLKDLIYRADPTTLTAIFVNQAVENVYGYTAKEWLSDPALWEKTIHFDDRERVLAHFSAAQGQFKDSSIEYRIVRKDGTLRWVKDNFSWEKSPDGPVVALNGIVSDITERKRAEEALSQSEKRFRALTENISDVIAMVDPEGQITYVSPGITRVLGYTVGEIVGQNEFGLVHPDDLEMVSQNLKRVMDEHGASVSFLTRERHKDGSWRWVEGVGTNLLDEPGVAGIVVNFRDITERVETQEELRRNEERFRVLIENSADAIALADAEGTILFASPGYTRILGYSNEELVGRNALELVHPDNLGRSVSLLGEVVQTPDASVAVQVRERHKDGSWRWLEGTAKNLLANPSVRAIVTNFRDITERFEAEERLRQNERKFKTLFEIAPVGIMLIDRDSNLVNANSAIDRILRMPRADLLAGKHRQRTYLRTDGSPLPFDDLPSLRALREHRPMLDHEVGVVTEDGETIWTQVSAAPLDLPDAGAVVVTQDITERRRAESRIKRQLHRLKALRTIDMAISTSFDMTLSLTVLLNQAMMQLGVSAAAILLYNPNTLILDYAVGKGFASSAIEQTRLRLGEGLAGHVALERHKTSVVNLAEAGDRYTRSDFLKEEGFVSYYATPLIAKGELKGVLEVFNRAELHPNQEWLDFVETLASQAAIAIDNSNLFINLQRANAELEQRVAQRTAELHQLNSELQHANRAKDEFLATMSHELRTPLNSILGLSESLLEETRGPLNERQQEYLKLVESSGQHLLQLINDVLDLSKIEAGKFDYFPQVVDVEALCRSSLAFVKEQAMRKSIRIVYEEHPVVSEIRADPRRLKQMLVNLLTNAVKFTLEGGQVTLRVQADADKDLIQISVIDTGIGIAPEDLEKLFRPFVQLDSNLNRQYEGTGLGLALVQKMADVHGGSVEVESEVGKGSRFTINLPWTKELETLPQILAIGVQVEAGTPTEEPGVAAESSVERRVVLLAEDNNANILTVSEYLESYGYTVVVAHDGWEAIAKAEETGPDIILMDIQMPALDGLEATRHLRTNPRFTSTPIIALTALAMPGDRERCLEAGATEYMSKPVSLKTLRQTIESILPTQPGG